MNYPARCLAASAVLPSQLGPGVFETLRVEQGRALEWQRHHARLKQGAQALGLRLRGDEALELERYLGDLAIQNCAVRLALHPGLEHSSLLLQARPIRAVPAAGVVLRAFPECVLEPDPLCIYKRTERELYDRAWAAAQAHGAFDGLLADSEGHWVECATANLHACIDGEWWSPGARQGVLPGLFRERFLSPLGSWREAAIPSALLRQASAIWITNSVLGAVRVARIEGL
jgi:para-aminobenzoate synthetase / 4-amino-4-deoxychorismate lyase